MDGKDEDNFVHEKMGKLEKGESEAVFQGKEDAGSILGNDQTLRQRTNGAIIDAGVRLNPERTETSAA